MRTADALVSALRRPTVELALGRIAPEVVLPRTGASKRRSRRIQGEARNRGGGKRIRSPQPLHGQGALLRPGRDGVRTASTATVVVPKEYAGPGPAELASRLVHGRNPERPFPVHSKARSRAGGPDGFPSCGRTPSRPTSSDRQAQAPGPRRRRRPAQDRSQGLRSLGLVVHGARPGRARPGPSPTSRTFPTSPNTERGIPAGRPRVRDRHFLAEGRGRRGGLMNAVDKAAAEMKGRELESVDAERSCRPIRRSRSRPTGPARRGGRPGHGQGRVPQGRQPVFEKKEKPSPGRSTMPRPFSRDRLPGARRRGGQRRRVKVSSGSGIAGRQGQGPAGPPELLERNGFPNAEVEVLSAYKPGYSGSSSGVLPAIRGGAVRAPDDPFAGSARTSQAQARLRRAGPMASRSSIPSTRSFRAAGPALERISFEARRDGRRDLHGRGPRRKEAGPFSRTP